MKITESRANDILRWLDDEAENHALLFAKMTLHRDAATLIRQLQADEQAAWLAGMDEGREQGRSKDHPPPSAPEAQGGGEDREPDDSRVICPACCHQFRAIPVQVQRDMIAAGFEPPFTAPPSVPVRVTWADFWIAQGDWTTANDYAAFEKAERWLLAQQPAAAGEEILVNAAHDVYTLPLQPSGLSSGPRFVVHVPGPEQQPAAVDGADRDDARRYRALVATGKYVPAMREGWGLACGSAKASKAELDAAADALTAQLGGSDNDR